MGYCIRSCLHRYSTYVKGNFFLLSSGLVLRVFFLQMVAQINIGRTESPTKMNKIVNKFLWVFGTSRNAILVVVCGILGFVFCQHGELRLVILELRALTS